jgi:hypothetical protein
MPEYETTFNYLLTHIEIPGMFFRILDQFYDYMVTSPQGMQLFMQNITECARERARQYPHVQPSFPINNFVMYKYMRTAGDGEGNDIVIVDIPNCERETDCSQIAFPCRRKHARYFTCELSSDFMTGEKFYITGEWTPNGEGMTHHNYGQIDTKKGETFADTVRKIVYGEDADENKAPPQNKKPANWTNDPWMQTVIANTGADHAPPEKDKPSLKTATLHGEKILVSDKYINCEKCDTANCIYDMEPPYLCYECGAPLDTADMKETGYEGETDTGSLPENDNEKPDDDSLDYYAQLNELAGMGWACYQHNELNQALQYFDRILEQEDDNTTYFQCRSVIHKALGDVYKADYDLFRAKLIDMKDRASGHESLINTKAEEELGLEKRAPLIETEEQYAILRLENGKLLFNISAREGEERLPELFYSGGKNALLRRRVDQYVLLTSNFDEEWPLATNDNYEDIYKTLNETDEIFVAEFIPYSETKETVEAYQVPVRHLPQVFSFDTPEEIRADGYPLFASLAALVRTRIAEGLPISEILSKDDIPTLAAVLAREEDYPLLDKYIGENLPLNAKANWLFKDWQPTPLFYVSTYKAVQSMKDPVKMIRYLAKHGADPNIESEEGDTPLGNQCYAKGTPEIMKALLEAGADPNKQSHIEAGNYLSPLFMILLPEEYNEETHIFKPLTQNYVERAKLLVAAGADVKEKRESGETPLGLALTFAEREQRRELFTLLREKGANLDEALKGMENLAEKGNVEYSRALNDNIWRT